MESPAEYRLGKQASAGVDSRRRPKGSYLLCSQSIHELAGVSESRYVGSAAAAAAASAGCVAFERPEADERHAIGDDKGTDGVDVVQGGEFVRSISISDHHGDANVVKGDAGLLVERLRSLNRGVPHIAGAADHYAVIWVGGAVVKRHQVDDEIAAQGQALDLLDDSCANASARNRIGCRSAERLDGKAELQVGELLLCHLGCVDQVVNHL